MGFRWIICTFNFHTMKHTLSSRVKFLLVVLFLGIQHSFSQIPDTIRVTLSNPVTVSACSGNKFTVVMTIDSITDLNVLVQIMGERPHSV
jgi:hypothetical protein